MPHPLAVLLTADGAPALIDVQTRESQSAPGRLKVCFTTDSTKGLAIRHPETGEAKTVAAPAHEVGALCPEFRLEMN